MSYNPPVEDMKFVFRHLLDSSRLAQITGRDDISVDLADAIFDEAGKLARDVIAPLNHHGDTHPSVLHDDGSVETPDGFVGAYSALASGGWTAIAADEQYGGQAVPMAICSAVDEMWQSANMSFSLCHLLTQGLIYALQNSASEAQKQTFLPALIEGRWTGTMNLTEPQAGTDLAAIKTKAVKNGDHYLITGQKIYITYGEHDMAENIIHLVLARTPDAPEGVKGISVFIVPKYEVNDDGSCGQRNDVRCLSLEKKLGIKGSPTAVLQYGETGGAKGYLVGEENQGLEIMFGMMNHARFAVGLQGVAISERAYQQAAHYALDRVQGAPLGGEPGMPIAHHPDVMRLLGVMKAEIEAMRALVMSGGFALDAAHIHHDDNGDEPSADHQGAEARAALLVPIIKGWLTERSVALTSDAVQVHGGMGFIEETGIAQHYRDARILPIYEGTTAIQANDLMFRKTIRDKGEAVRALLAEMTAHMSDCSNASAAEVIRAVQAAEDVLEVLLARANSPRHLAADGVNWLMLLGYLCGGWMMARSEQAASVMQDELFSDEFTAAKQTTAQIYISHCLPHVHRLAQQILQENEPVLDMQTSWLSR